MVLAAAFGIFWTFQWAIQKITRAYFLRYTEKLPGIERYRTYLSDDILFTENRGYTVGFALENVTRIFKDANFLYIDFNTLGRIRMPLSVFEDESSRLAFEELVASKKKA